VAFMKILHQLDGFRTSLVAFRKTLALAKACGAEIHVTVVEKVPHYYGDVPDPDEAEQYGATNSRRVVQIAQDMARKEGLTARAHVVIGTQTNTLARLIEAERYDLVVIASGAREDTLCRRTTGRTARLRLANRMPCSVLVLE